MYQLEALARELVEALNADNDLLLLTSTQELLNQLDVELTRVHKDRVDNQGVIDWANIMYADENLELDSEPVVTITTAGCWVSCAVFVPAGSHVPD